jgi:hypothetical protein
MFILRLYRDLQVDRGNAAAVNRTLINGFNAVYSHEKMLWTAKILQRAR